jgi:hypothetical protein
MTLDDMYQIAITTQREAGSKIGKAIMAVEEDAESNCDDKNKDDIAAFQN